MGLAAPGSQLGLIPEAQVGQASGSLSTREGWPKNLGARPSPPSTLSRNEDYVPSIPGAIAHSANMCPFENSPRKERSGGDYANAPSSAGEPNFNKYACSSLMCLMTQGGCLLYNFPSDSQLSEFI